MSNLNGVDESVNSTKNKDNSVNKQKLINNFCKDQINIDSKNKFLDDIFDNDKISGEVKENLEKELTGGKTVSSILDDKGNSASSSKYEGVKLEDIKISDFKNKLFSDYSKLKSKRNYAEIAILSNYNLTPDQKKKVSGDIKLLTDKDLDQFNLIMNDEDKDLSDKFSKRNKIISKFLGKDFLVNEIKKSDILLGIGNIFQNFSKDELIKINDENENLLGELEYVDTSKRLNTTSDLDILSNILKLNSVGKDFKKKIIENFLPSITLKDAKKLGLINNIREYRINEDFVKNIFDNEILEQKEVDKYIKELQNKDSEILLKTSELLSSDSNIDKIISDNNLSKEFLSNFISKHNFEIEEHNKGLDNNVDAFKDTLSKIDKVFSANKFRKDSYILIDQTDVNAPVGDEGEDKKKKKKNRSKILLKIADDGSVNGKIRLLEKGIDGAEYNSNKEKFFGYNDLLNYIEKGNGKGVTVDKCEILTQDDLDERILKGEMEPGVDLDHVDEFKLDKKKEELENKLVDKVNELRDGYKNEGDTDDEINKKLYKYDDKGLKTNNYKHRELIEIQDKLSILEKLNKNQLIEQIKKIDTDYDSNKFDFGVGTTFTTKKADGEFYYEIKSFDDVAHGGKIIISDMLGQSTEVLSFLEFLTAFKEQNGIITSTSAKEMGDFSGLIEKLKSDDDKVKGNWDQFKIADGKILKNETNNDKGKSGINYDYLVADGEDGKGNELMQIHSISGNKVKISFGEYEEIADDKDKSKIKSKSFGVDSKTYDITIGELYARIAKYKLRPRSLDEEKDVVEDNIKTEDIKNSFLSRYLNRYSFKDIYAGAKLGIESIESYMKEGEEEHAAKFAEGFFGKIMPSEISNDLSTRVEGSQKKRQDDYIQKLKDVDSGPATKMISGWLHNKDSKEHKKEAGMIFMLEKYGVLYAKGLTEFKGSFLWYETMGGKVGDKLYLEVKHEMEVEQNVNFTEEQLLYRLIINQCKGRQHPKRRSRLHKEFNRFRNQGKEEEEKTGIQDAANRRTVEGRIDYCFGEIEGGTYPNGRGGYEKVLGKGGTMAQMNEVPFVTLFSGVAYGFEQDELDKWKDFPSKGFPIISTRFFGYRSNIELFNRSVLTISEIISQDGGKYKNIYKDALELFKKQKIVEGDEEKIKRGRKFYEKYGEVLTNSMSMVNIADNGEESKYADLVITGKEKKGELKDYYNFCKSGDKINFGNEDFMTDGGNQAGMSGGDIEQATSDMLAVVQGAALKTPKLAKPMWQEITNSFHAISTKNYDFEEDRKVKLKHELSGLITGFMQNVGAGNFLESYNSPTSLFSRLNDWGVYMKDIVDLDISPDEMRAGTGKAEGLLDRWMDQIIDYESTGRHYKKTGVEGKYDPLKNIQSNVKEATNNMMYTPDEEKSA